MDVRAFLCIMTLTVLLLRVSVVLYCTKLYQRWGVPLVI